MEELKIRLCRAPWHRGSELLILTEDEKDSVVNLTVERREVGVITKPSLIISDRSSQTLMDDLWQAGYRPTEGAGSAGSLRATENHLSDFRKIVSKTLEVDLK